MPSYEAPADLEELQLLRQVLPAPLMFTHSATMAVAERLSASGDAMVLFRLSEGSNWLEITAQGRRRLLDAAGPVARCPFCDARPGPSAGGLLLAHPPGADCILRDFATSNVDGWNKRAVRHG